MKEYEKNELNYENKMAERYNDNYHSSPLMLKHDEDFVKYVSSYVNEGDRVLDLGCGPASLWSLMKTIFPKTDRMVGVDLSDEMIRVSKESWENDEFYVSSIFNLPFEAGSFDVVIVSSILHHIPDNDLPDVFNEIYRVLDEHGRIVGREPVGINRLADIPGWFSGAIMSLRHLIYRLDKVREYPEPDIGPHHHAYDPEVFFSYIEKLFKIRDIQFRNPLSDYASRCKNQIVCSLLEKLDNLIKHKKGQMFFYVGYKNYATSEDVIYCVKRELEDNLLIENEKEFMMMIVAASKKIEELLEKAE